MKLMHLRRLSVIAVQQYIPYKSMQFSQLCSHKRFISIINHHLSLGPLTLQCCHIQHSGVFSFLQI